MDDTEGLTDDATCDDLGKLASALAILFGAAIAGVSFGGVVHATHRYSDHRYRMKMRNQTA